MAVHVVLSYPPRHHGAVQNRVVSSCKSHEIYIVTMHRLSIVVVP